MKKISKLVAIALSLLLSFTITSEAQATENNRVRIFEIGDEGFDINLDMGQAQRSNELTCAMKLSKSLTTGNLNVSFSTRTGKEASEIGVKDFYLQEKSGIITWDTLYTNSFCDYKTRTYVGSVEYLNPVEGKTYRAIGTHYAIIDGVEYTYMMFSDELTY